MSSTSIASRYALLGMLGFACAAIAHEALGHGGACLAIGGRIALLTTVYARCSPGSPLVDSMGVVANFAIAGIAWLALIKLPLSATARLVATFIAAFNVFWGAGYLLYSAVLNIGDWAFVLRDLRASPSWLWRAVVGIFGAWLYLRALRWLAPRLPAKLPLLVAYFSAGALAVISVAVSCTEFLPALVEAVDESLLAAIGMVFIAFGSRRPANADVAAPDAVWLPLVAVPVIIGFLCIQGRGIGSP